MDIKNNKKITTFLLSLMIIFSNIVPMTVNVHAEDNDISGLRFNKLMITELEKGIQVADLLKGEIPSLKAGVTYSLDVEYQVPSNLQFSNTYLNLRFGDGIYVKTLPGATFKEGAISSTGFEELIKAPTGTGTSPYGYPPADSEKSNNGNIVYKTKNSLTNVSSQHEICFSVDNAYLNQDKNQILSDVIKASLSTDSAKDIDSKSFDVKNEQEFVYNFYIDQKTEIVSKGGTTSSLEASATGGKFLTEANSKTSVDVCYPSDIEFVGLEEKSVYKKYGAVVSTVENNGIKTTTVEWDEPGSYSGGLDLFPYFKVPKNNTRANGSSFDVYLRNLKKTVWNDTPNADRTSRDNEAWMKVTVIDGDTPEIITSHALVDSAPNWSLKKYDSYNVRLGAFLIKNELDTPTKKKILEIDIDNANTAIIRGVTIPYHKDISYGKITWTSASGKSGVVDASVLKKSEKVSALITNTALGLDIDDSIKSIKVELGNIPNLYNGIKPMQDLLDTWNPNNKFVTDEFYGWSYISCGVYGAWKKGTDKDVVSTVKLYTQGEKPTEKEIHKIIGRSTSPKVLNGVGSIDKKQILGGETFKVSGRIDDENWDWNPLQEPVIYMIMPEGFSYSNLKITEGKLEEPTYIGEFDKDGIKIKVWKYIVDVGKETRGQYQPDFTSKSMKISFDVQTDNTAKVGTYHINDFLGITTKDFAQIGAVIKAEHWDRSNWNTKKYTNVFGDQVNSGKDMVSLSESNGIMIKQAYEISAKSELFIPKTGKSFVYDSTNDSTMKATTPVLTNEENAVMRVNVRNNTIKQIDHATLFVPLLNEKLDFGKSFMPEGENKLPLELQTVKTTENFTIKYIKVEDGKKFDLNNAPQEGDYKEVTNPSEANMLMIVSKHALAPGDGGRFDVEYKVGKNITAAYNDAKDVISPVLDYDIEGNKSTLTKEPAAVTFYTDIPETIDFSVVKMWKNNDGDNIKAPVEKVDIELLQDGKPIKTQEITEKDGWKTEFKDLLKINQDTKKEYLYTVREKDVDKDDKIKISEIYYKSTVNGNMKNGFTITNSIINTKIDINGEKVWEDANDQDGIRPTSVTIHLLANGEDTGKTAVAKENTKWMYSFKNLPTYDKNANKIDYTVKEDVPFGYKETVDGTTITNLHQPLVRDIEVSKKWNIKEEKSVTINLLADGKQTGKTLVLDAENGWKDVFRDLPQNKDGNEIKYTISESKLPGYISEITGNQDDGFVVTNTYKPKPVVINPQIKKVVEGHPANSSTFTFNMKALDTDNPMPKGSANNIKTTKITGSGSGEFGEIEFTLPGTYSYEIVEVNDKAKNYTYDESVYIITLRVEDRDGELNAEKTIEKAGKPIDEVVFRNKYEKPMNTSITPDTGDIDNALRYGMIFALSAAILAMALFIKKKII